MDQKLIQEQVLTKIGYKDEDKQERSQIFGELCAVSRNTSPFHLEEDSFQILFKDKQNKKCLSQNFASSQDVRSSLQNFKSQQEKVKNKESKCLISYKNPPQALFDFLMNFIVIYSIFSSMFFLVFRQPEEETFDWIVMGLFFLEIFLVLNTEIYDQKANTIIRNRSIIFRKYLDSTLLLDLAANIPWRFIFQDKSWEFSFRLIRIYRIPQVINLLDKKGLRILIKKIFYSSRDFGRKDVDESVIDLEDEILLKFINRIVKLMLMMIFLIYFLANFWYLYAKEQIDNEEGSFILYYQLQERNALSQILVSVYFIQTTLFTIGYGDYTAQQPYEFAVIILIMYVGIGMFGYIMGSIKCELSIWSEMTEGNKINLQHLDVWIDKLEKKHKIIPVHFKKKLFQHFLNYWENDRICGMSKKYWKCKDVEEMTCIDNNFLSKLNPKLMDEIIRYLYSDIFYKFKFIFAPNEEFADCKFKNEIAFHLQPRCFFLEEDFIVEGEYQYELLLIVDGIAKMGPVDKGDNSQMAILQFTKTVLGDYEVFHDKPAYTTFRAYSNSIAYAIPKKPLITILKDKYPKLMKTIISKVNNRHREMKKIMTAELAKTSNPKVFSMQSYSSIQSSKYVDFAPFEDFQNTQIVKGNVVPKRFLSRQSKRRVYVTEIVKSVKSLARYTQPVIN